MAKKFKKTIQRVETAKINEVFSSDKSITLDDLKLKLAIVEKEDPLSDLKNKLFSSKDEDPLAELKKSLNMNKIVECFEDLVDSNEEEIIEEIINIETPKEIEQVGEIVDRIPEEEIIYNFIDDTNNNILIRNVKKTEEESLTIHIAMNNVNFEKYKELTTNPFDIYYNNEKILDFYVFKKNSNHSYNFKKDIYILRNNLIIDAKTYLLQDIKIVNINS